MSDNQVAAYPPRLPLLLAAKEALRRIHEAQDILAETDHASDAVAGVLRIAALDLKPAVAAAEAGETPRDRLREALFLALPSELRLGEIAAARRVLQVVGDSLAQTRRRRAPRSAA